MCVRSACRQVSEPLLESRKAARELSQTLSAIPRWSGSGLGPSRRGGCADVRAGIQTAARERGEVKGGKVERKRAGAIVAAGAGDLLLPEVEEAAGERGRVVVIARALGLAHGTSIAEAAPCR